MSGERELAEAGCHGHDCCTPCSVTLEGGVSPEGVWRPGPWLPPRPVSIMMTNSRIRTRAMIPNTFTQRGVLVLDPRSGLTRVSSRVSSPVSLSESG